MFGGGLVLVLLLRDMDEEMHLKYFHMSAGRFDDFIRCRLQSFILHQFTHSIPTDITWRPFQVLASGGIQQAVVAIYKHQT